MTGQARLEDLEQGDESATLHLDGWGELGDTLAEYEGSTINVFGGIPGEEVVAHILRYRRRRQSYVSAQVLRVLKPSPHRVEAPCRYFGACTGCQWQHIDYEHQLDLKRDRVSTSLKQYQTLSEIIIAPTMPSPQVFNYRNHARFTVRSQGRLGYINRMSRRFVEIDECMLMDPWINEALGELQGKCAETTQLSVRLGVNAGEWLIQPTMQNPDISLKTGQTHYREKLLGHTFRIASPSFAQVNTPQTERMIELVRRRLELRGDELLLDAYAGVGVFAALTAPYVKRVVAIEESSAAIKDAAVNTIGIGNLEFIEAKTEDAIGGLQERPDAVILDPSRLGCHPNVLDALVSNRVPRVVYVSCDPDALARDLDRLVSGGYGVDSVEPLDMFPQTHHVECLATLTFPS
ncbi:MAG: class I SAM-dependent RNA methyltransferase [Chloroflexi bacterium]|nr:class I SAM-dependent RNA methyltransferase [Chloroflexota bacterium]